MKPVQDPEPLQPEYLPREFIDRENTATALNNLLQKTSGRNIHLQGPRGTGKTHLTQRKIQTLPTEYQTSYIDCRKADTQYKALQNILHQLNQEQVKPGHHTSTLQRKIEEQTQTQPTVIILDEIDFLLPKDGDSLLYTLSRLDNQLNIITISNQITDLQQQVEERTYSSLQPYTLQLEPLNGEQNYQILENRAQKALKPQTLQRQALTYIASTTSNNRYSLQWLKTAANHADPVIKETTVQKTQEKAQEKYAAQLLEPFTPHHQLLYQAIQELNQENDTIQAGDTYQRYQQLTDTYNQNTLSNRRISDYLKHLEKLQLIKAEYHYGGNKGKTREIQLLSP